MPCDCIGEKGEEVVPIIRVWDVAKGGEVRDVRGHDSDSCPSCRDVPDMEDTFDATSCPVPGHVSFISSLAFSPDGATLCSASFDSTIRLWDVATMEERCRMHAPVQHHGVAFSGDGTRLLACFNGSFSYPQVMDAVRVWDVSAAAPPPPLVLTPPGNMVVCSAAFAADGARVVACCMSKLVHDGGEAEHSDSVDDPEEDMRQGCIVTWSLAAAGGAPEVREVAGLEWDYGPSYDRGYADNLRPWSIGAGGKLSAAIVRFRNEQYEGGTVHVVGEVRLEHMARNMDVDVSADGTHVLMSCHSGGDRTAELWSLRATHMLWSLRTMQMVWSTPSSIVTPATFGPDGRTFVTAAQDRKSFIVWG